MVLLRYVEPQILYIQVWFITFCNRCLGSIPGNNNIQSSLSFCGAVFKWCSSSSFFCLPSSCLCLFSSIFLQLQPHSGLSWHKWFLIDNICIKITTKLQAVSANSLLTSYSENMTLGKILLNKTNSVPEFHNWCTVTRISLYQINTKRYYKYR